MCLAVGTARAVWDCRLFLWVLLKAGGEAGSLLMGGRSFCVIPWSLSLGSEPWNPRITEAGKGLRDDQAEAVPDAHLLPSPEH